MSEAAYLETLNVLLSEERPSTAYYSGAARIEVLRLLISALEPGGVQAMEQRSGLSDEDRRECQRQGVIFWDEGGQPAELVVRDVAWSAGQLKKVIEWGGRPAPRIFFFADDAVDTDRHDSYIWELRNGCLIGKQKMPKPEIWKVAASLNSKRLKMAQEE